MFGLDKVAMEMELRFGFCHIIAYRLWTPPDHSMTIQNNFKSRIYAYTYVDILQYDILESPQLFK